MKKAVLVALIVGVMVGGWYYSDGATLFEKKSEAEWNSVGSWTHLEVKNLVYDLAKAWETGDMELLLSTINKDIVFAYPGRRLDYDALLEDFEYYRDNFSDTKVYIHNIIIDETEREGEYDVAVEWQFAYTDDATGKRLSVSDGIIGLVRDGKISVWKEYLDGRVSRMQQVDALPLEEGEEPFPSPIGSLRNFCELTTS